MAKTEFVLRPGDSLSVRLEFAGQALRLDLSLGIDGLAIAPPPARTATRQILPPPVAVVPPPPAVFAPPDPEVIEEEDEDTAAVHESAQAVHEQDQDIDIDVADLEAEVEEVSHDPAFSPHAATMVPPTRASAAPPITLDDAEFAPTSPKPPAPRRNDTLPAWEGGARAYRDPMLEKKKATAAISKAAPAIKAAESWGNVDVSPTGGGNTIFSAGPAQAPRSAPGVADGDYTVFLTPPKSEDKKQAAAKIIAQIQGINMGDALALAGKMIVPVAKNVTEQEAHGVRDMFKDAGLSCRITQKR